MKRKASRSVSSKRQRVDKAVISVVLDEQGYKVGYYQIFGKRIGLQGPGSTWEPIDRDHVVDWNVSARWKKSKIVLGQVLWSDIPSDQELPQVMQLHDGYYLIMGKATYQDKTRFQVADYDGDPIDPRTVLSYHVNARWTRANRFQIPLTEQARHYQKLLKNPEFGVANSDLAKDHAPDLATDYAIQDCPTQDHATQDHATQDHAFQDGATRHNSLQDHPSKDHAHLDQDHATQDHAHLDQDHAFQDHAHLDQDHHLQDRAHLDQDHPFQDHAQLDQNHPFQDHAHLDQDHAHSDQDRINLGHNSASPTVNGNDLDQDPTEDVASISVETAQHFIWSAILKCCEIDNPVFLQRLVDQRMQPQLVRHLGPDQIKKLFKGVAIGDQIAFREQCA